MVMKGASQRERERMKQREEKRERENVNGEDGKSYVKTTLEGRQANINNG